jgi:hypothetical protein
MRKFLPLLAPAALLLGPVAVLAQSTNSVSLAALPYLPGTPANLNNSLLVADANKFKRSSLPPARKRSLSTVDHIAAGVTISEPTVVALQAMTAMANGTAILLTGYYVDGDMTPQRYIYSRMACAAPDTGSQFTITAGGCAKLAVPNGMRVTTQMFGDKGDGTYNFATGVITGTDDTVFIQNAINYAMRNGIPVVEMSPAGGHETNDTIQLGYGNAFYTVGLIGQGGARAPYAMLSGYSVLPTKTDRCAINIQAGRNVFIRGLGIIGQNYAYNASLIGSPPFPTTASGWFNPTLVPRESKSGGLLQYAPYAAVCIDAYSGTAPSTPYPNVTFPSWTRLSSQYGKLPSSDTELTDLYIAGFGVAIVVQPNNYSGNGDFTKINRLQCVYSTYCIGDGDNQSRAVQLANISSSGVYTVVTNMDFGQKQGKIEGPIQNISGGQDFQLVRLIYGYNQFDELTNLYCEGCVRIGTITASGSVSGSVTIRGLDFYLDDTGGMPGATGVVPASLVDGRNVAITLDDASINDFARMEVLYHNNNTAYPANLTINGGGFYGATDLGALFGSAAIAQAVNYSGAMFVGDALAADLGNQSADGGQLTWENPTTGTYMASGSASPTTQMLAPMPVLNASKPRQPYTEAMAARGGGFVDNLNRRRWAWAVGPTSLFGAFNNATNFPTAPSYTGCDVIAFTVASRVQSAPSEALTVGQILYHQPTSTLFVITAIGSLSGGAYPVTAQQMNNMTVNVSTGACVSSLVRASQLVVGKATVEFYNTNVVVPSRVMFGTFSTGSTNVSNVTEGDGNGGELSTYLRRGDPFYGYYAADSYFQWPYRAGMTITGVTNGTDSPSRAGTITLSAKPRVNGRFPILPLPVMGGPQ